MGRSREEEVETDNICTAIEMEKRKSYNELSDIQERVVIATTYRYLHAAVIGRWGAWPKSVHPTFCFRNSLGENGELPVPL